MRARDAKSQSRAQGPSVLRDMLCPRFQASDVPEVRQLRATPERRPDGGLPQVRDGQALRSLREGGLRDRQDHALRPCVQHLRAALQETRAV